VSDATRASAAVDVDDDRAPRDALAIGGVVPAAVIAPPDRATLADCVRDTAAAGAALVPLGLGAHRGLGHAPARYDVALSTRHLRRVVEYAPADMTVTVESGVTVIELDAVLAPEGQWLPIDPPLPASTTIGGLIAADLAGVLAPSQGRVRDFVLGVAMVTADGRTARAGGKVVKNVAGYDLMKLITGSLGTLAVVTEATLKVRPRPEMLQALTFACADRERGFALAARMAGTGETALALALVDADDNAGPPALRCVLGGVAADVAVTRDALIDEAHADGAIVGDVESPVDAGELLADVRDFRRVAPGDLVLRVTMLPTRGPRVAADVLGACRDARVSFVFDPRGGSMTLAVETADPRALLTRVHTSIAAAGAVLVVERWPDALADTVEVWTPLPASLPLMRRMKDALDPAGTLAPGRFVGRI
jgi:glycolate oxidase FAD binding subunit